MATVSTSPLDLFQAKMETFPVKELPLAFVLLVVAAVVYRLMQPKGPLLDHIPILKKELGSAEKRRTYYATHAMEMLKEGYEKFKNGAFQVETAQGPRILLGPKQLEELRTKPDNVVDNEGPIKESLFTEYTGMPFADEVVLHSIKAELTPKLGGSINIAIAEEVDYALKQELPTAEDWTPVQIYAKLLRIVAIASTRIFIGPELAHNEDWLKVSIGYTVNIAQSGHTLRRMRPWLRPFLYRFLPEVRRLRQDHEDAIRLLAPVIRARREAENKEGYEKPNDMLQWMMDARIKKQYHDRDYVYQAEHQLILAFAAIHTTTMATTNMLYDLASMPDFINVIRGEVREELVKNGGVWDGRLMKALKKTDSFMKESQRTNPIGWTLFNRKVLKSFTLSDGTYLPKGATVSSNGYMMSHDPEYLGSDNPWEFDPLRYYKKGLGEAGVSAKEVAGKHQFVSLSIGSQMFGYGRHACPGRFFAGNEIKLILVKLLNSYDMRLEGTTERYPNWVLEAGSNPDATRNILIKRVE